jgi:hypothetical protein
VSLVRAHGVISIIHCPQVSPLVTPCAEVTCILKLLSTRACVTFRVALDVCTVGHVHAGLALHCAARSRRPPQSSPPLGAARGSRGAAAWLGTVIVAGRVPGSVPGLFLWFLDLAIRALTMNRAHYKSAALNCSVCAAREHAMQNAVSPLCIYACLAWPCVCIHDKAVKLCPSS